MSVEVALEMDDERAADDRMMSELLLKNPEVQEYVALAEADGFRPTSVEQ